MVALCSSEGDSKGGSVSQCEAGHEERLRSETDFSVVYRKGRSWANELVVLRALPNGLETVRCGFAVGKRVGKAVVRNRVKRRLREVVRSLPKKGGWDMVFIARQAAAQVSYDALRRAVEQVLVRANLLCERKLIRGDEA